jgi:hypothetical protein
MPHGEPSRYRSDHVAGRRLLTMEPTVSAYSNPPPPPRPPPPPPPAGSWATPGSYYPPPSPRPSPRGRIWPVIVVIVVVVVVVIIAGLYFLAFYSPSGSGLINGGTLHVVVSSNHVTQTVTVSLTVNGNPQYFRSLAPGNSITTGIPEVWTGSSCQTYTVVAVSSGGGLGSESDQATPQLCSGATANVQLSV